LRLKKPLVWIKCIDFVHFVHIFYLSFDKFVITVAKNIKKYYNKVGSGRDMQFAAGR